MTLALVLIGLIIIAYFVAHLSSLDDNQYAYSEIALFSEGKQYWSTFEPIIEALIAHNITFSYYTMDKEDPIFKINNPKIRSTYIGKGAFAYYRFNNLKAKLLIATTPNIGNKNYPIKKSPNTQKLIHVWHSFGDYAYAWYHKYSLDFYDEIIVVGTYMEEQIRFLEKKRHLAPKKIFIGGIPYLDTKLKKMHLEPQLKKEKKIIIFAPSWGNKSALWYYGLPLFKQLLSDNWTLVIRPHPQTIVSEYKKLQDIEKALAGYNNIIWDKDASNTKYLEIADLMISDTSSVRLDFAVLQQKPVITLEVPIHNEDEYEYRDLKPILINNTMDQEIGAKIYAKDINTLAKTISELLSTKSNINYQHIIERYAPHIGSSGNMIAEYIISQTKNSLQFPTQNKTSHL